MPRAEKMDRSVQLALHAAAQAMSGPRGVFVTFFGRPASTHKGIALLALNHNALLIVTGTRKIGKPIRYQMVIEDVIEPDQYRHRPDAVRAITQRYTHALEQLIRSAPEQYLWLHRRWKSQPAKTRQLAA
jgi:KDO2-lipid IV(A) lauroyltransferase